MINEVRTFLFNNNQNNGNTDNKAGNKEQIEA